MNEPEAKQDANWLAVWWYFVLSICGATIAGYSMAPRVFAEIAKTNDPQAKEILAQAREMFDFIMGVSSGVALVAVMISVFLLPRFVGPVRKTSDPTH